MTTGHFFFFYRGHGSQMDGVCESEWLAYAGPLLREVNLL